MQVKNVGFSYTGKVPMLFRGAEMGVDSASRIVLLGENGNGKTTLVKLLIGDLEASEGEVVRNGGARIALVNQHHADQIDLTLSPLQFMMDKFPGGAHPHTPGPKAQTSYPQPRPPDFEPSCPLRPPPITSNRPQPTPPLNTTPGPKAAGDGSLTRRGSLTL